jgi:hypothetical protein
MKCSFLAGDEMENPRPVHEWLDGHVTALKSQFLQESDRRRGIVPMRVTKERLDAWSTKGLDGICDMMLERSNQDLPTEEHHLQMLEADIDRFQRVLENRQFRSTDNSDEAAFKGIQLMATMLYQRVYEQGMGALCETDKIKLRENLEKLKVALYRFRQRKSA